MSDNNLSSLQQQLDDLRISLNNLRASLDHIIYENDNQKDQILVKIDMLKNELEYIKDYELQKFTLFNNKVNQAYINQEVQNINMVQDIDQLKEQYTQIMQIINQFKEANNNLIKESANMENWLEHNDQQLQELSNDQGLLFQAVYNMRYTFDAFNEMLTKERVMNTAIITVLVVELLSKGVINNANYINNLRNVINQILEAYKSAGYNIDFSQELDALSNEICNNALAIRMPHMVSMTQPTANENFQENKNIIDFKDILKKHTVKSKSVNTEKKSQLYADFQNKLNEVLSKKRNDKKKNNNDDDKKK